MALSSCVYTGFTQHTRRVPHLNRFCYNLYLGYIDLRELRSGALDMWPVFSSRTPWALASALESDHCAAGDPALPLEERVRAAVRRKLGSCPAGPVRMLTALRILGLEFNPVSFYFLFDEADTELQLVVAEVNNIPWFEQHMYFLTPVEDRKAPNSELRRFSGHAKAFHVSPFIDMKDIEYSWLLMDPGEEIRMKIGLNRAGSSFFMASLDAKRAPFSAWTLLKAQITHPAQTVKVVLAIMWEAVKLFKRGFVFVPHPYEKETTSSRMIAKGVSAAAYIQESFQSTMQMFVTKRVYG